MGDWNSSQDFYFDEKGVLLEAVKKEDWFLENKCARQIRYRGIYKNYGNPKLHRIDKFYNENDKEIDLDSPNCKKSKKEALENVERTDKITFRNLEGFMKAEKINITNKVWKEKYDKSKASKSIICFTEITSNAEVKIEVRIQEEASKSYMKRFYEVRKRKSSNTRENFDF